jgi:DNA ligase D-like protein (predicted 3'-phosphoesterase)
MSQTAKRITITPAGGVDVEALCSDIRALAERVGLLGWVRTADDRTLAAHAEGSEAALAELDIALDHDPRIAERADRAGKAEGHEQFAIRGVAAGVFVVQEHQATAHHFDFRLEVDGVMRSWAVPKGPSMDPAAKRLAVQVEDHGLAHNEFEGATERGGVIIWDRGLYEQGGRVRWPEALDRGHAVFVLHGEKLAGGFALQRTGRGGPDKPQWLLVKRRDELARSGSDIVAERPESVASGQSLDQLLDRAGDAPDG